MYEKLIKLLDDPKLAGAVATMLLAVFTWFARQMSFVPKYYIQKANTKRNENSVIDGARRDQLLNKLKHTGAIYIHLIRYHNGGGELKKGVPIKLTVDIEKLGHVCSKCVSGCRMRTREFPPPIIDQWQNITITGCWNNIVRKTVLNPHDVTFVTYKDMDHEHRDIWDQYNIKAYKEIFVKHRKTCFYTIGISFCNRFEDVKNIDGALSMAAKQMANLL
jgi:hypothetical protein